MSDPYKLRVYRNSKRDATRCLGRMKLYLWASTDFKRNYLRVPKQSRIEFAELASPLWGPCSLRSKFIQYRAIIGSTVSNYLERKIR